MLACAAFSEQFMPAVSSEEAPELHIARAVVPEGAVVASRAQAAPRLDPQDSGELRPHLPEQLVMLVAGSVLMGLGGALRATRPER